MTAGKKLGAVLTLAFALAGIGCSSTDNAYGSPETTKSAVAEKFKENGFSIIGTTTSWSNGRGELSECYTLRAVPDAGMHYTGCADASKSSGIQIQDLKNLDISR